MTKKELLKNLTAKNLLGENTASNDFYNSFYVDIIDDINTYTEEVAVRIVVADIQKQLFPDADPIALPFGMRI